MSESTPTPGTDRGVFSRVTVAVHKLLALADAKLAKRDKWLRDDNPGMACKYHNQAEGVIELLEAEVGLVPAEGSTLFDRLGQLRKRCR